MVEDRIKIKSLVAEFLLDKTEKEIEVIKTEYFPKIDLPMGWIGVIDHPPYFREEDLNRGYSSYRVLFDDGTEGYTAVADPDTWLETAKEKGVTHWYNY